MKFKIGDKVRFVKFVPHPGEEQGKYCNLLLGHIYTLSYISLNGNAVVLLENSKYSYNIKCFKHPAQRKHRIRLP